MQHDCTDYIILFALDEYTDFRSTVRGVAEKTIYKDTHYIKMFAGVHGADKPTTASIIKAVSTCRKKYAVRTFNGMWKSVRIYLEWLVKHQKADLDIKQLKEIRLTTPQPAITAAEIPTPEEFLKLIDCCTHIRDKAILWLLYDSCGRKTETLHDLNWGDIVFDDKGAKVNLSGKTKRPRYIRLMASVEFLKLWRSAYPHEAGTPSGNAPLFVNLKGIHKDERIAQNTVTMLLRHISPKFDKATGKHYRLFPHLLRHMGITHLLLQGYSMQFVSMRAWGTPLSQQILTYVHISGADVDKEMMERSGILSAENKRSATTPLQCPVCGLIVSPGIDRCPDCGAKMAGGDIIETVLQNPALLAKVLDAQARKMGFKLVKDE